MRRSLSRLVVAAALGAIAGAFLPSRDARADCARDGGCASNQYCALADGGDSVDASAGTCALEPCVVNGDCANGLDHSCLTSVEPHECVQCVSTANCPGADECDVTTHTCVAPIGVDAAVADASRPDASDGSTADSSVPAEPQDAGEEAGDASEDAGPPDLGSLSGGAWDCDLAAARALSPLAIGGPLGIALLFIARRRARRRQ